ncbi:peptide chain release factor H [Butyrivibrio fibrisolvens]|uniref:Peptide chain release factor H n=1 Tax=Butyrivibrio fibrisolvens TaxID=831 RepID=A0A317G668_BUTFI|nr:peptide chain release factor H [Butyrivibrio fibrisolvens]PWT28153.1 peptide chain release factor H [Butyrivibrio fibrisolvens]
MIMQISSGMGPIECRAAVGGIFRALQKEYPDIQQITCNKGEAEGIYSSIIFSSDQDLSHLEGTMEWICKSKYRPGHKRKNWFVDVSIIPETDEVCEKISPDDITIESYRSGGPGGQHVNKTESGVRITHLPTGITVTSTKERSQYMNKQDALRKLSAILKNANNASRDSQKAVAWAKHAQIQRGNPVRIYEGERFVRR